MCSLLHFGIGQTGETTPNQHNESQSAIQMLDATHPALPNVTQSNINPTFAKTEYASSRDPLHLASRIAYWTQIRLPTYSHTLTAATVYCLGCTSVVDPCQPLVRPLTSSSHITWQLITSHESQLFPSSRFSSHALGAVSHIFTDASSPQACPTHR
ncbi:uncharacterized protein MEPE_03008 [Melanopsichium pennsylvanicum]|uniref:Uncharacterized protein n=1 Tax=Melanopsichium pennsylvanicum TaxID=63383 RepID=A0AAJ5C593_9BASI|nr:uncharacterized protein MEPE_03008 [Melanopsichium pennsylvanicum]